MVQDDLRRLNEETTKQKAEIRVLNKAIEDKEKEIKRLLHDNEALKKRIAQLSGKGQKYRELIKVLVED